MAFSFLDTDTDTDIFSVGAPTDDGVPMFGGLKKKIPGLDDGEADTDNIFSTEVLGGDGGDIVATTPRAIVESGSGTKSDSGTDTGTTVSTGTGIPNIYDPNVVGADGGTPAGIGAGNVLRTDITYVSPSGFQKEGPAGRGIYVSPEEAGQLGLGAGRTSVFDPGALLPTDRTAGGANIPIFNLGGTAPSAGVVGQQPGSGINKDVVTDTETGATINVKFDEILNEQISREQKRLQGLGVSTSDPEYGAALERAGLRAVDIYETATKEPIQTGMGPTTPLTRLQEILKNTRVMPLPVSPEVAAALTIILNRGAIGQTVGNIFGVGGSGGAGPGAGGGTGPGAGGGTTGGGTETTTELTDEEKAERERKQKEALAQMGVVLSGVPTTPRCGENEELVNGRCVPRCPAGQTRNAQGVCEVSTVVLPPPSGPTNQPQCPEGQERVNGQCVPKCPTGQTRNAEGICVVVPGPGSGGGGGGGGTGCPEGQESVNGVCVPKCPTGQTRNAEGICVVVPGPGGGGGGGTACPEGQERVNGQCVAKCPTGQTRNADGICVVTPTPTECPEGQERVNGTCVPKCPTGYQRNAAGVCVVIPTPPPPVPTTPTTPTTPAGGTFNVTVTGDQTPIAYEAPKAGDPFQRYSWEEASSQLGMLNTPVGQRIIGYQKDASGKDVPVYSRVPLDEEGNPLTVGGAITSEYGKMAGGMTQADLKRLQDTFGGFIGQFKGAKGEDLTLQQSLTRAAAEQTTAANRALREGNLADAAKFGMEAKRLRDEANAQLYGDTGTLGQYATAAQNQVARDIEALRAAERGELSRESIRSAQQAALEAAGARGQVRSRGAMAQEVLNREAAIQQRQQQARQNLAQSMAQLGQGIGYQAANVFDPMAAVLGQQYGMQTSNVGLNQALYNQGMGLASGQGGYGFAQQMVNPFSQYAADVYGTNVNARNAFAISEANRVAALEAARMGEAAARNAANTKLALGGVDFLYKYGMGKGWWP
jgi:hypothetical protein